MPVVGPHHGNSAASAVTSTGVSYWQEVAGVLGGCPAFVAGGGDSHALSVTDFRFSLPEGATVTYVGATAKVRDTFGDGIEVAFRLTLNGAGVGGKQYNPDGIGDSYRIAERGGNPATFWGYPLTRDDVNSSSFGVQLTSSVVPVDNYVFCDSIDITVAYVF